MRLALLAATVLAFAAGGAAACPMHTAGHGDQAVAQSTPKKPPQQSSQQQAPNQG